MIYSFGDYELDTSLFELRRCGEPRAIEPKAFDLLLYLVRNRDRLVTKDEILDAVWEGRIVSEATLSSYINAARKAIGDSGKTQAFIRTLPRRGFRFMGEVSSNLPRLEAPNQLNQPSLSFTSKPSIAVLPFRNMSTDPEQEYFSHGIAEDITTRLSKVSSLFVFAFNSSALYAGMSAATRQIGVDLGAQYVLDGSVRKAGEKVRISTELFYGNNGGQIWAEHYDRELVDIFAVQDEVTEEIVKALSVKLTPDERQHLQHTGTLNLEAHDLFLRGREKRAQQTEQTNAEAKLLFERALDADKRFSAAAAYLSVTYGRDYANQWARPARKSLELQVHWAERSVELDEDEPLAHGVLAVAYLWVRRHDEAIAAANKALKLNPNFAFAYMALGWTYHYVGEQSKAIDLIERSMRLDPNHPDFYFHFLAQALFQMERFDDAATMLKRRLERSPHSDISRVLLAATYGFLGRRDEAHSEWHQALASNPNYSLEHRRESLPYKDPSSFERIVKGLAKADLPP